MEVVLGSSCVGIVVVLCMVHMAHKVAGMVNDGLGHMEVNSEKGLVSRVVQSYVEEVVHKHMVGLVG